MNLRLLVNQSDIKLKSALYIYILPLTVGLETRGVESPLTPSSSGLKGELPFTPFPSVADPAGEERKKSGDEVGTFPFGGWGVKPDEPLCNCEASDRSCWPGLEAKGEL